MSAVVSRTRRLGRRADIELPLRHPMAIFGLAILALLLGECASSFNRYYIGAAFYGNFALPLLWLLVALTRFRPRFQFPFPIYVLLALQVWSIFCLAYISTVISKTPVFDDQLVLFLHYSSIYLMAAVLIALVPGARRFIVGLLLFMLGISALLGALQFFKVGFALRVQDIFFTSFAMGRESFEQEIGGTRVSGFAASQSVFGTYSMLGYVLMICRFRSRPLRLWEWALAGLFGFCVIACQTRSVLVPGAIATLVVGILAAVRYRAKGFLGLVAVLSVIAAGVIARSDRFGYILGAHATDTGTLDFRKNFSWAQAAPIYKAFPWTGIGPDYRFAYMRANVADASFSLDKWVTWGTFDGSYHHLLASLGLVGCLLFAVLVVTILAGFWSVLRDRTQSDFRRDHALGMLLLCVYLLTIFATFEDLWWKGSMWPVLMALALGTPTNEDRAAKQQRPDRTIRTSFRSLLGLRRVPHI